MPVGKLVTRVTNDSNAISMMFTHLLVNLVKNCFIIVGVLAAMLCLNYVLTLMVLCFVPFIVLFTLIFRKFTRSAYRKVKDRTTDMNTFLSENLSGMKITQIFNREGKKLSEFDERNNSLGRSKHREILTFAIFRPTIYVLYISSNLCLFYLAARGYERYEISNFCRDGAASLHNLKYWHCDDYLGLGAGAHSYFEDERFSTTRVVRDYIDGLEIIGTDINIVASSEKIDSAECMEEYIMLGMRLSEGIVIEDFEKRFNTSFAEKYGARLDEFVDDGFVEKDEIGYRFTSMGMFVSNYILSSVLDLGE
jgi:hypothetical protein